MLVFFFSYQFTSSCPVFLSVRLRLVKKLCRTLSSVSLLCVAGRMGREAGPLTPGQHVRVHKNGSLSLHTAHSASAAGPCSAAIHTHSHSSKLSLTRSLAKQLTSLPIPQTGCSLCECGMQMLVLTRIHAQINPKKSLCSLYYNGKINNGGKYGRCFS